jgi:oligopeptide transport system substrate-binding protein
MKSRKWIALLLVLVLAVSMGIAGCGKKEVKADKEQFLNLNLGADVRTLDASKATDSPSKDILAEIYEGLTRMENDGKKDIPTAAGAEKWETSSDGLVWTFHLRDHKWTDGKPVTAKDYVYSWTRLLDPNTASDYAYFLYCVKGGEAFNGGKGKAEDLGLKAVDDKTFQVTLERSIPYFILLTPFSNLFPIREDGVKAGGEKYGQDASQVITNGPFTIAEWAKGSKIVLKKNDTYWDAKSVKLTSVTYLEVKEEAPRMQMFDAKQLDATGARGDYLVKYKKLADSGQLQYRTGCTPVTFYECYNCVDKDKLFTNSKIRLAFSLAIDREAYVKDVYKRGIAAYGYAPYELINGEKLYREAVPEPLKEIKDKDPKELLKLGLTELGLDPNGKYTVNYLSQGQDALTRTIAEFLQNQWQTKLGVTVKLDSVNDFPQFLDRMDRGEFQIAGSGWQGDYNDPMTFFDMFTTGNGNNSGKYSNPKYDELIKKVSTEMDSSKRLEIFKQCESILLVEDAAIAPTYYRDKQMFLQGYVKNFETPMFGPTYEFKYAYTDGRQ